MQEVNDCVLLVIIQSVCDQTNYSSQKVEGKGLICLECDYKPRRNQGHPSFERFQMVEY